MQSIQSLAATGAPSWDAEGYRRRRGRISLAELAEITARAHQLHLQLDFQELRRLREMHARLDWPRAHRPDILFYTPNQLRQLIRLGNVPEPAEQQPTMPSSWRPGPLGAPWHLPSNERSEPASEPAGSASEWWSWRGWGAGALLLVAALLLVRATDRCFTRNYARSRRRRSEEWPTPNVLATSQHLPLNVLVEPAPQEFDIYPSESDSSNELVFSADLPPPYSECADKHTREEPPPPYSACYVAYSNPKDGTPSVRFLNSQRQDIFENDTNLDSDELREIAHSSNGFNLDTGQIPNNPIGDRIYKLPYFDNNETDDSDDCNGEFIAGSIDCINIGPAPIATQDMTIDISDVSVNDDCREAVTC